MGKVRRRFSTGSFWLVSPASLGYAKGFPGQLPSDQLPNLNGEKLKFLPGNNLSKIMETFGCLVLNLKAATSPTFERRTNNPPVSFASIHLPNFRSNPGQRQASVLADSWREP